MRHLLSDIVGVSGGQEGRWQLAKESALSCTDRTVRRCIATVQACRGGSRPFPCIPNQYPPEEIREVEAMVV